VTLFGVPPKPAAIEALEGAGVDEVLFNLPTEAEGDTLRRLDRLAELL
jgi:hypothetical protein